MRAAALAALAAAPAAVGQPAPGPVIPSSHRVVFTATVPWTTVSMTHNAFSPIYPTEAIARQHPHWLLSSRCVLAYKGQNPIPPEMVLLASGGDGLDPQNPDTTQVLPAPQGETNLTRVNLTRMTVQCINGADKTGCFWFLQLTLSTAPGAGMPDFGAMSELNCTDLKVCEPAPQANASAPVCFPDVQSDAVSIGRRPRRIAAPA